MREQRVKVRKQGDKSSVELRETAELGDNYLCVTVSHGSHKHIIIKKSFKYALCYEQKSLKLNLQLLACSWLVSVVLYQGTGNKGQQQEELANKNSFYLVS